MSNYLTIERFRALTIMPSEEVDALDAHYPGWLMAQSEGISSLDIDTRLRKRYAAPFVAPYPIAVEMWVARLLTQRAYLKRGVDTTDEQFALVIKDADKTWEDLKEAADAKDGLFDLPIRQDSESATGITKGAPLSYSEASPYVWTSRQREAAADEEY